VQIIGERSLSVAAAVKTLNEIRHQPASPGVVRRAQSLRVGATADQMPFPPPPPLADASTSVPETL